jgi:phosphatidylinositol alpha-1,6-mannosyltransferase
MPAIPHMTWQHSSARSGGERAQGLGYTPRVPTQDSVSSALLALTGLRIDGGIAVVSRCIARAFEEEAEGGRIARVDRVLLLDRREDATPPPAHGEQRLAHGSQPRFVWETWRSHRRHRHDLVCFDLVGLARSVLLPLPGFPPRRFAVFVHGTELAMAKRGSRARALREADCLLANSEFTAAALRAQVPERADRVRVVPLCIDPERARLWEAAQPVIAPKREPAALLVGRMWSEERGKGHDALIEGWPEVRRRVPAAELWIVGGGDDQERLRALAHERGVGDAVRFLGRVPDAELGDLYRRASVYAMPSRQEGFGLAYAEAMWHGLPCIGSTADAAGQVIRDGETGRLVPYGDAKATADAVASLLADPERARAFGETGRRRARSEFGYARFRERLLAALGLR